MRSPLWWEESERGMYSWGGAFVTWGLIAMFVGIVLASAFDVIFDWGIVDATRDLLAPLIQDDTTPADPGDCDPRYGSC